MFSQLKLHLDLERARHFGTNCRIALDILLTVFMKERIATGGNELYLRFEAIGGVDLVEDLQGHKIESIYQKAAEIVQTYGNGERIEHFGIV